MNKYENELQKLKQWDEVQITEKYYKNYNKIYTSGHGYLCVPKKES